MTKLFTICLVLTAFCIKLQGQEIITDRPDQTESSTTIPVRTLQIEAGLLSGNDNFEKQYLFPTSLFRYGLTKNIELRLAGQIASIENKQTSENLIGIGDLEIGAKIQILKNAGINTEIAFISHLIIPTGSADMTSGNFGTINKFAISHSLTKFLDLGYNAGYNYPGDGNGDFTYSLVTGAALSDKFGYYIEPYGEYTGCKNWISNLDTGFTYLIKNNIQLDISYGIGLNQKMNYLALGFSWNLKT